MSRWMIWCMAFFCTLQGDAQVERPNILFICIDDLNDWTGYLGGHPNALTPHLDQLASESVVFTRAYCPAPACNPSRAAIMTGIRPSTSGVYLNSQPWRDSPALKNILTIPQYLRRHGYKVLGSGKVYHGRYPDPASWDIFFPSSTQQRPPDPQPSKLPLNGIPNTRHFDWGPLDAAKEEMSDWMVADWVIDQLNQRHEKPFFLACGFFRPHLPWFVPQEYFDKFPLDRIVLPKVIENDIEDLPQAAKEMIRFADHEKVIQYDQWQRAVQGYLASTHFVDECLGRVLDGLHSSHHASNTIVVLWSDHGWHLGEKRHWRKFALWENSTRTHCLIRMPGDRPQRSVCQQPVNLIDLYPTLLELSNLPANQLNEGTSLVPLLSHPEMTWLTPSISTYGPNNHTVRLHEWRYSQYADGGEELYNLGEDPDEWYNLANLEMYTPIKDNLKALLPAVNVPGVARDR